MGTLAVGGSLLNFTPAQAALPNRLPINGSRTQLFKNKKFNQSNHRMQSFAFDSKNHKLFAATLRDGHNNNNGDLEIARILIGAGSEGTPSSQKMYVSGAGHAVAFGVEPIGTSSHIWVEYDADSTGYGRKLARFEFEPGRDTANSASFGDLVILSGSKQVTCSVDHIYNYGDGYARLAVRRGTAGVDNSTRFEIYKLRGLAGTPVLEWAARPKAFKIGNVTQTWQGWTFYGGRIYSVTGDHGVDNTYLWVDTPVEPKSTDWAGSPQMARDSVNDIKKQPLTSGITDWEPEGLAAYRPTASSEKVGLYYGLTAGTTPRTNSIYYRTA